MKEKKKRKKKIKNPRNVHAGPNGNYFMPVFFSAPELENLHPWPEGYVLALGPACRQTLGTLTRADAALTPRGVSPWSSHLWSRKGVRLAFPQGTAVCSAKLNASMSH